MLGSLWLHRQTGTLRVGDGQAARLMSVVNGGLTGSRDLETLKVALQGTPLSFAPASSDLDGDRAAFGIVLFRATQRLVEQGVDPLVSAAMSVRVGAEMIEVLPLHATTKTLLLAARGRLPSGTALGHPDRGAVMADLGALMLIGAAETVRRGPVEAPAPNRSTSPAIVDDGGDWIIIPPGPDGARKAQDQLLRRARHSIRRGDWPRARHELTLARELGPEHPRVMAHLALTMLVTQESKDDRAEARRLVRHALNVAPEDAMVQALRLRIDRLTQRVN